MPDQHASSNNTPYSEEDLEYFRKLLLNEQAETRDEIEELKQSLENQNSMEDERASSKHHHVGNVGSEEQEKERLYLMNERKREKLEEINAALSRIDNGTYGVCEASGDRIDRERLEAVPYARKSITDEKKRAQNARNGNAGSDSDA